jgi:hypothetical protein
MMTGTPHRVGAHAARIVRTRVIAGKDYAVESLVDACHHAVLAWPGTDHGNVVRQLLDEQVLPVAM